MFYDEQPVTFGQSWHQRLRWAKGFYQVFSKYGKDLIANIFKGKRNRFSCYDMTMTIMPAMLISSISMMVNGLFYLAGFFELLDGKGIIHETTIAMLVSVGWYYGILFLLGFITTLTEWKKIHCAGWKKIVIYHHFSIVYVYLYTYFYRSPV